MKRTVVLLFVAATLIVMIGFYMAIELPPASKIKQYIPQPGITAVLIKEEDSFGKLIDNMGQSKFGSSINLEVPTYFPSGYKVQQVRDDPLRESVNMFLSMSQITDKTTNNDFTYVEGGIIVYVSLLPNDFNQTELVKMRKFAGYAHNAINDKDFFFFNSTVNYEQDITWNSPAYVEMYDKQIEIQVFGFAPPSELAKIVQSIKYDQSEINTNSKPPKN